MSEYTNIRQENIIDIETGHVSQMWVAERTSVIDGTVRVFAFRESDMTKKGVPDSRKRGTLLGVRASTYRKGKLEGHFAILRSAPGLTETCLRRTIEDLQAKLAATEQALLACYATEAVLAKRDALALEAWQDDNRRVEEATAQEVAEQAREQGI